MWISVIMTVRLQVIWVCIWPCKDCDERKTDRDQQQVCTVSWRWRQAPGSRGWIHQSQQTKGSRSDVRCQWQLQLSVINIYSTQLCDVMSSGGSYEMWSILLVMLWNVKHTECIYLPRDILCKCSDDCYIAVSYNEISSEIPLPVQTYYYFTRNSLW